MNILNRYIKSEFVKNVAIVMTGTAASQAIALALTPILTRHYSPEDFGYFTTFMAIYAVLCAFATGKYERAILLLKDEQEIKYVSSLGLCISIGFSIVLYMILGFLSYFDFYYFEFPDNFKFWLFILPLLLVLFGVNLICLTYLNAKKDFKAIAKSRVIKTLITLFVSLLCIYFMKNMGGLILGEVLGLLISTLYVLPKTCFLIQIKRDLLSEYLKVLKRFKSFPKYNIPSDLLNNGANQFPVFFMTANYGAGITGQYALMKRMLDAPVNLLSSSILEVFRQRASEQYMDTGSCRVLFIKTAKNLFLLSMLPFTILFFWAEDIFIFVFGEQWSDAGHYASIFSLFYFFKFVSSPLSYVFYIAEKQRLDFLLHIYIFISSLLIFYLPTIYPFDVSAVLWLYCLNFLVVYAVYFFFSYKYSKKS